MDMEHQDLALITREGISATKDSANANDMENGFTDLDLMSGDVTLVPEVPYSADKEYTHFELISRDRTSVSKVLTSGDNMDIGYTDLDRITSEASSALTPAADNSQVAIENLTTLGGCSVLSAMEGPTVPASDNDMKNEYGDLDLTTCDGTSAPKIPTSVDNLESGCADLDLIPDEGTSAPELSTSIYNMEDEVKDVILMTGEGTSAAIFEAEENSLKTYAVDKHSEVAIGSVIPVTIKVEIEDEHNRHQENLEKIQDIVTVQLVRPEIQEGEENANLDDQETDGQQTQIITPSVKKCIRKNWFLSDEEKKKSRVENFLQKTQDVVAPVKTRRPIMKDVKEIQAVTAETNKRVTRGQKTLKDIVTSVKRKKAVKKDKKRTKDIATHVKTVKAVKRDRKIIKDIITTVKRKKTVTVDRRTTRCMITRGKTKRHVTIDQKATKDFVSPVKTKKCVVTRDRKTTKDIVTPVKKKKGVTRDRKERQARPIVKTVKRENCVTTGPLQTKSSDLDELEENGWSEAEKDNSGSETLDCEPKTSNESVFRCDICGRIYSDQNEYDKHRGNENKSYPCKSCQNIFCSKERLSRHWRRMHSGNWNVKKESYEAWRLTGDSYKCDLCGKIWESLRLFMTHRGSKESYPCDSCDRVYCNQSSLTNHKEYAHSSNHEEHAHSTDSFPCSDCSKSFKCHRLLKIHFKRQHGTKPYQCQVCGEFYSSEGYLRVHTQTHKKDRPFLCQQCGKSYKRKEALNEHIKFQHTKVEDQVFHACTFCDKAYNKKSTLSRHMLCHSDARSHVCQFCGKAFKKKIDVEVHERCHTKNYPYKCEMCEKAFNTVANRKRHMSVHTGDKPHSCDQCGKRFTQVNTLKAHMKIHTGERPYACLICDQRFIQKSNLKGHMKNKHGTTKLEPSTSVITYGDAE